MSAASGPGDWAGGQPPSGVRSVAYPDWDNTGLGVQCLDTEAIRHHFSREYLVDPRRADFHVVLLFVGDSGFHSVDSTRYAVSRGSLLLVRPGQVQEWDTVNWPRAKILVFRSTFLLPERPEHRDSVLPPAVGSWPVALSLDGPDLALVEASMEEIEREIAHTHGSALAAPLLLHLLCALLIRLVRMGEGLRSSLEDRDSGSVYRRFRAELERNFMSCRTTAGYAQLLGYSERTLHRAVAAGAGVTPRRLIDERVCLEAQRLLIHTTLPLKLVAAELGFSEATNFVKFFRRTTGRTPHRFRIESHIQTEPDTVAEPDLGAPPEAS
jgi:AraC-like DNA-binding protein